MVTHPFPSKALSKPSILGPLLDSGAMTIAIQTHILVTMVLRVKVSAHQCLY